MPNAPALATNGFAKLKFGKENQPNAGKKTETNSATNPVQIATTV